MYVYITVSHIFKLTGICMNGAPETGE